jgi:hypothetical protein
MDQQQQSLLNFDLNTDEGCAEWLRTVFWQLAAHRGNNQHRAMDIWRSVTAELEKPAKTLPPPKPRPIAQSFAWDEKIQHDRRILDAFLSAQAADQLAAARDGRKPATQANLIADTIETLANPDKSLDPITVSRRTMERLLAQYASQTRN